MKAKSGAMTSASGIWKKGSEQAQSCSYSRSPSRALASFCPLPSSKLGPFLSLKPPEFPYCFSNAPGENQVLLPGLPFAAK